MADHAPGGERQLDLPQNGDIREPHPARRLEDVGPVPAIHVVEPSLPAQVIGTAPDEKRMPQTSPDGRWNVYISWPLTADLSAPPEGHIMRMPAGGGPPVPVFAVKGYATNDPPGFVDHALMGFPSFRCPSRPGALCVLAELVTDGRPASRVLNLFQPFPRKWRSAASTTTRRVS